jgi:hypothetical protein
LSFKKSSVLEEAVNEVKRQAVAELQRAVAAAESKACELVATERAKMEKLLLEARKQAAEEALAAVVVANQQQQQAESSEVVNPLPAPSQQNVSSLTLLYLLFIPPFFCREFLITYMEVTMSAGYILLQLFCSYNLWYM